MTRVRGASKDDRSRLMELHALVHDLHARQRPDFFVPEPDRKRLEALFDDALDEPSVHVLVAESPGGRPLAGYALARVVKREGSLHVQDGSAVKLEHLAVDPAAARRGVGTALLEAVRETGRAAGCRQLIVNVWCFNEPARSFYEASGLVPAKQQLEQGL